MEKFLNFFELMPIWQKVSWIIVCLGICWLLEGKYPLFSFSYRKWKHARVNLIFLLTTMLINVVFGMLTIGVFLWVNAQHWGLIHYVSLPTWAELLGCILIFEFIGQYLAHYLLHRVKWMWRLHMIHHSDSHVDATTGTRHHPGDFLIREIFALLAVIITGAPVGYYFFYRICNVFFTYLTHANINMPHRLDKLLSWVFVTPNMHKFHHHYERPWTDTNFGNIFSIWDRIFGTFVYEDVNNVHYGLDVLEQKPDEDVLYQMRMPFDKSIKTDR